MLRAPSGSSWKWGRLSASAFDLVSDIGVLATTEVNNFYDIKDPTGDQANTLPLQGEALARVVASWQGYSWDHAGTHLAARGKLNSLAKLMSMLPKSIKTLEFPDNVIRNTTGLDAFQRLASLDLSHNAIDDVQALAAMPLLKKLLLIDNKVSGISLARSCRCLEGLDISCNDIEDLSPLAACKSLKDLTLSGTTFWRNGIPTRSSNPIAIASGLAEVPFLKNPFLLGQTLAVRYGVLTDGADAQFVGTATRIDQSASFRVHLTRGAEVMDDIWTLRRIFPMREISSSLSSFAGILISDLPTTGTCLTIVRANNGAKFDINMALLIRQPRRGQ